MSWILPKPRRKPKKVKRSVLKDSSVRIVTAEEFEKHVKEAERQAEMIEQNKQIAKKLKKVDKGYKKRFEIAQEIPTRNELILITKMDKVKEIRIKATPDGYNAQIIASDKVKGYRSGEILIEIDASFDDLYEVLDQSVSIVEDGDFEEIMEESQLIAEGK